jgi:hypothetical protein
MAGGAPVMMRSWKALARGPGFSRVVRCEMSEGKAVPKGCARIGW